MFSHVLNDLLVEKTSGVLQLGGARMALLDIESGFWGIRRQIKALLGASLTNSILQQAGANGGASFAKSFVPSLELSGSEAFSACLQVYQSAGFGQFEITSLEWPIGHICIRANQAFEAWMMIQNDQPTPDPCCAYTAGVLVGFTNIIAERQDVVCIEHSCQGKGDKFCEFELLPAIEARDQAVVAFSPDPGLGRKLNLLEMLFERMPMGIAVLDREYRIQRYNPTWEDFALRYAPPAAAPLAPGVRYFDHLPGTETTVIPLFERVLTGETVRQNGVRLESEGIVTYWDLVLAPLVEDGEVTGMLTVVVDATERVEARLNLEQRVEERTRELATLLQVSRNVTSTLELEPLLNLILDQLKTVVEYTGASILILEGQDLVLWADRGPIPKEEVQQLRIPLDEALVSRQVVQRREPIVIPDVRSDKPLARAFRQTVGGKRDPASDNIRSWLGVPLMIKGDMLGMLTLEHSRPDFFTAQHADLVLTFANQVAVAIANARLFEKAEEVAIATERNRLARDLHDSVTQTLFSSSLIAEVLPRLWQRNPEEALRRLEELRQLTKGALSEMRTLLLELRPAALADIGLDDLMGHQVNALNARTRLPVKFNCNCIQNPPPNIKVMCYRIAQEAFNNIAKHADATAVIVWLDCQPGSAELVIQDNGVGFDLEAAKAEGLGLGIMQERAQNVGAQLEIHSQIRDGTRLRIFWQESSVENSDD